MTREDLDKMMKGLTVGKLKEFIEKNQLPDDALVLVQRVEDRYFEKHGWETYNKEGEHTYHAKKNGMSEQQIKDSMEKYHPAWCCVSYKDDKDLLFIDLHY